MTSPSSITAIILTKNEEQNLSFCLESLAGLCHQIFVVDSGSTDKTAAIATQLGAAWITHPFETHAKQWNWALENLPIRTEWVLALDADQQITAALKEELLCRLPKTPAEISGYYLLRKQIFRGKWIRFGGYWPKYLLKLFRTGSTGCDENELVDFRFYLSGKAGFLKNILIEHNHKEDEILFWLQKHLHFIELLAQEEYHRRSGHASWKTLPRWNGTPDQRVLWLKSCWYRFPLYVRPFLYFVWRFVFLLGFLDGPRGWLFHFLQSFWFRLMIDVRLRELPEKRYDHPGN